VDVIDVVKEEARILRSINGNDKKTALALVKEYNLEVVQ
jgi:hypothetical protein